MDEKWIHDGITDDAIEWAKKFGEELTEKNKFTEPLTTSQLRKFFGELKRIDTDFDRKIKELPMLQPMLAYAVGRRKNENKKIKIEDFEKEILKGLKSIRDDEKYKKSDFKNFVKLVEAIVAYHKYFGGE